MIKRMMALLLALALTMLLAAPAAVAEDMSSEGYYYVYTDNGKALNVRETPGGKVVGNLKYGSRIYCYYKDGGNGWALIDYSYDMPGVGYGTYACYVSSRFLRKSKPPARTSASASAAAQRPASADTVLELNQEFKSAKKVTPYAVTVRPTRVSGWVNMHWAPSTDSEILATYKANDSLVVIQTLDNWYQVEDQATGNVGFISKESVQQ